MGMGFAGDLHSSPNVFFEGKRTYCTADSLPFEGRARVGMGFARGYPIHATRNDVMTALRIDVDRLQIALHGVSATVAEDFSTRIGRALEQRLSGLPADAVTAQLDLGLLELGRIDLKATPDAGALAGIVADRLVEVLAIRCATEKKEDTGGNG